MTPDDARADVERTVDHLVLHNIAIDCNQTVLRRDGSDVLVTWASGRGAALFEQPTIDEFERLVRERQFSVLLRDGALVQMSMRFTGRDMVAHRFAFFPCPVQISGGDVAQHGVGGYLELLSDAERLSLLRLWGPIRFDYDARAARRGHPACHLTVAGPECRIAVTAPLCPRDFVALLLAHWHSHGGDADACKIPTRTFKRTITSAEEAEFHLARRLASTDAAQHG